MDGSEGHDVGLNSVFETIVQDPFAHFWSISVAAQATQQNHNTPWPETL